MQDKLECTACKWLGNENEIRKKIIFHQTQEEPEEWEWYCPNCNKTDTLEEVIEVLCRTCEDESVKHDGDQCTECYTVDCERHTDEERGH